MRIISGKYGGRIISAPKSKGTRPMTDKVRAALLDSLGAIEGWKVLDCYAGSGAIGFEALSRGANRVVAIEQARSAIHAIKANQKALGLDWGYELHEMTVERWLASSSEVKFDLVVADPPYEQINEDVLDKLLAHSDLLVISHGTDKQPKLENGALLSQKKYGDSILSVFEGKVKVV